MNIFRFRAIVAVFVAIHTVAMSGWAACGQNPAPANQVAVKPELAILDTDIGDDYDDATA